MPILRGKNVLLRPYRRSDLPGILSWTNDTEATRYLTEIFDQPYTEKNGEDFLNYALSGGSERMMFVMADPVTEEYWGQISLERISRPRRHGGSRRRAGEGGAPRQGHRARGAFAAAALCVRYAGAAPRGIDRVRGKQPRKALLLESGLHRGRRGAPRKRGRTASSMTLCPWRFCGTSGRNGRNRHDRGQANPSACV